MGCCFGAKGVQAEDKALPRPAMEAATSVEMGRTQRRYTTWLLTGKDRNCQSMCVTSKCKDGTGVEVSFAGKVMLQPSRPLNKAAPLTGRCDREKAKWRSAVPGRPSEDVSEGRIRYLYDAWVARSELPKTRGWVPCIDREGCESGPDSVGRRLLERSKVLGCMGDPIAHV
jgi:hypothetical protein